MSPNLVRSASTSLLNDLEGRGVNLGVEWGVDGDEEDEEDEKEIWEREGEW